MKRVSKPIGLAPSQTGRPKTLEMRLYCDSYGSCSISQNRLPKSSLLDLGQSEVAALKFFSILPVAGPNRAQSL